MTGGINISVRQRETFRAACSVILPKWKQMPDGGELGLEYRQLDLICAVRKAEALRLLSILDALPPSVTSDDLEKLENIKSAELQILVTMACAAYYLHPEVKRSLQYTGQLALTLPKGGFGCEELVLELMAGPKRFRTS